MSTRTTIIIDVKTRNTLRHLGRKEQTYDDIINELIGMKNNVPIESKTTTVLEVNQDK